MYERHAKPATKKLVRVIRDVRDSTKDYYIAAKRAEELYVAGELALGQVYSDRWEYMTPRGEEVR